MWLQAMMRQTIGQATKWQLQRIVSLAALTYTFVWLLLSVHMSQSHCDSRLISCSTAETVKPT